MESYGELIKKTREEKNIQLSKVEMDTSIEKRYLMAIEQETVDEFPGESYFLGFLRNYCEYLGLGSDEIVKLYHAKKIQEAPVPVQLFEKKRPKFLIPTIVISIVLILAGINAYLYFCVFNIPEQKERIAQENLIKEKNRQFRFEGKPETKRVYKGDQILFPSKTGKGDIVLTIASTAEVLNILTPAGNQIVELSEERELDIDGDGAPELIVYLSDITNTDAHGAEIRLLSKKEGSTFIEINEPKKEEAKENIQAASTVKNSANKTIIHEDTRAYPFTVNITFRNKCLLRYRSDRQQYNEGYYKAGETISITSNNGTRLWTGNNNAMKLQVIAGLSSYDLEIGKAGEVKVEDIKWLRDSDGKYRLVVLDVD